MLFNLVVKISNSLISYLPHTEFCAGYPIYRIGAQTVANSLKSGGEFHLVEFHTFNDLLSGYSYFLNNEPDIEEEGTYTENCDGTTSKMVTWSHSMSEVISALISAGLMIESFSEYAYSPPIQLL